ARTDGRPRGEGPPRGPGRAPTSSRRTPGARWRMPKGPPWRPDGRGQLKPLASIEKTLDQATFNVFRLERRRWPESNDQALFLYHDRFDGLRHRGLHIAKDRPGFGRKGIGIRITDASSSDQAVRRPLLNGAQLDDSAQVHDRDSVTDEFRGREVVCDKEVRGAIPAFQVQHQFENPGANRHVEHRDGLVCDDQLWLQDHRPGDYRPLLLASA